jgi:hypothetical protein
MGVIQGQLPDQLKATIDRQIAEGRAASEAEYLLEAASPPLRVLRVLRFHDEATLIAPAR